ncbi:hypothetical protein KY290_024739 [Solanum tuberosum]|uniref:MULE transposase domain-containing protein n=1 Tax=Solanum tuberosum TaxID=4113 RepID=A0ABQ7URJ6_SOLTU|nr:hypothetical protein KY284_023592 [Solanum tuberosum]KAH0754469.1 hypothetical protein KY290_024739 [Solanum tuberosum]
MVEVTIYFHHGVNKYINKLGFVGVQELIVLAPAGKYFEIIGDEGVRTLTSFISTEYKSIHLFATEDCELSVDVTDIVMHDGSFLLSPIVNEGTDCSESEDDSNNGMEIVKGMAFKDIAEAKQFCKLYALAKKVELVVVKSDKKRLRYTCDADGYPFLLLISGDLTTPGVSVKTLVDHIECETAYDNSLVDYSTIPFEAKCKRVKKEVLESLEGSFVDSYNKLEGYATELRSCNTGSDIVLDLSEEALSNGGIYGHHSWTVEGPTVRPAGPLFVSTNSPRTQPEIRPSVDPRPDLRFVEKLERLEEKEVKNPSSRTQQDSISSSPEIERFLRGIHHQVQVLSIQITHRSIPDLQFSSISDSNNSFYPLAWVVVDKETKRTWTWFMQHLQHSLELQNGEGLTFILDMQKGLLEAIRTVLPEAHQRHCARHIEANWCKIWGKSELKKLLWWDAWSLFTEEFEDQLQEIKEVN